MGTFRRTLVLLSGAGAMLGACSSKTDSADNRAPANAADTNSAAATNPTDPVASAMSAAPAAIATDAAVVAPDSKGAIQSLRAGKNGWTCMPDNPATPGPDPMCLDGNATKWAMAMMAGKTPPEGIGLVYMLAGGVDASNTDPAAKTPPAGKDWIRTGPHVMIVGAPSLNSGYKGGEAPDTKSATVMWAGTPYAHMMIPVS